MSVRDGVSFDVLSCLNRRVISNLQAMIKMFDQHKKVFDEKVHSCIGYIVSIFKPDICPIVRDKTKFIVEIRTEVELCELNVLSCIDHI